MCPHVGLIRNLVRQSSESRLSVYGWIVYKIGEVAIACATPKECMLSCPTQICTLKRLPSPPLRTGLDMLHPPIDTKYYAGHIVQT
jgi:hypothetical protein